MLNVGIVGIGFMGMNRHRILGSVRKPHDFCKVFASPGDSLCL